MAKKYCQAGYLPNEPNARMVIAGLILVGLGLGLAANVMKSADRLAALAGRFPWSLMGTAADHPASHRMMGIGFVVMGIAFIGVGLHIGT